MRKRTKSGKGGGIVFLVLILLFFIGQFLTRVKPTISFIQNSEYAEATVIGRKYNGSFNRPIVRFIDKESIWVDAEQKRPNAFEIYEIGDTITIRYDKFDHQHIEAKGFWNEWAATLLFLSINFLLILAIIHSLWIHNSSSKSKKIFNVILTMALMVFSLLILKMAFYLYQDKVSFDKEAILVKGKVIGFKQSGKIDKKPSYLLNVQFVTHQGDTIIKTGIDIYKNKPIHLLHQLVDVEYRATTPADARIGARRIIRWIPVVGIGVTGLISFLIALRMFQMISRNEKIRNDRN